jgi:hypothetical protein
MGSILPIRNARKIAFHDAAIEIRDGALPAPTAGHRMDSPFKGE